MEHVLEHAWHLKREGYAETTITSRVKLLRALARKTNLLDPEQVKSHIALSKVSNGRKELQVYAYAKFAEQFNLAFKPPRYSRVENLPFIPLEREVDDLIAGVNHKTSAYLQFIKESAARPREAWNIRWTDIDPARTCIRITPEKGSNPRECKISNKLLLMLQHQPRKWNLVFHNPQLDPTESLDNFRRPYEDQRRKMAEKLQNPRIMQITFKTLRHFKATMFYHQTKDILATMQLLGHENIRNTLVYTHLVNFGTDDDYTCKVAKTVDEAKTLIETGFEFVLEFQDAKLFRKRK